jgi:membrane-bound lytic murein transglycosylase D
VTTLARKHKVSPQNVAQWNKVSLNASFKPGQTVTLFVQGRAPVASNNSVGKPVAKAPARKPATARKPAPKRK